MACALLKPQYKLQLLICYFALILKTWQKCGDFDRLSQDLIIVAWPSVNLSASSCQQELDNKSWLCFFGDSELFAALLHLGFI